jgi:hypothetical protein
MKRSEMAVLCLMGWLAGGCNSHPPPHVVADLSSPKPAAVSFFRAISEGDIRTARDASIGTAKDKEWIDAMSSMLTGLRRYDQAIIRRFGHQAAQTDSQLRQAITQLVQDQLERLQDGIVREGPDTAEVDPGWHGEVRLTGRPPVMLRKEKGLWKVDLEATARIDPKFDAEAVARYRAYGKALHDAAYQIDAGRYKTLAEAEQDSDTWAP